MKILILVFLLLGISSVTVYAAPADPAKPPTPNTRCPPSTIIDASKCTCLSSALFMTCTGIDDTWITNFKPDSFYEIDTLIIIDSPSLPKMDEKFHNKPDHKGLTAKKVIFTINTDAPVNSHNLNSLLAVATDAIKIKSADATKPLVFDAPNFPSSLKTIVLDNVKITNYDKVNAETLTSLDRLQLNKVSITSKNPDEHIVLDGSLLPKLTHIEITNCESLTGSFTYIPPKECPGKEIVLNLQNNPNLKDLNLFEIFEKSNCKYFIDLSGSKLNEEFLNNNVGKIKPLTKIDQLYIVLRDVKLNCNQCVYDWWSTRKQYVHSVVCQNEDKNFLDHIDKSKMKVKVKPEDCKTDKST